MFAFLKFKLIDNCTGDIMETGAELNWGIQAMKYFNEALGDFVNEAANGGIIRHLVDLGYSADEIREYLTFQISDESLEKQIRKRQIENGTIEPDPGEEPKNYHIVKEQNEYGRVTFRKVYDK